MSVNITIGTSVAQFEKNSLEYLKFNDISYRIAHALTCAYVVVFYVILCDPCMCVFLSF